MADLGIEVQASADSTAELHSPATGAFRSTPQAQRVFHQAVALSKESKPSRMQGAHVVAAACDLEHGTLARALTALGVDRDRLRQAAPRRSADHLTEQEGPRVTGARHHSSSRQPVLAGPTGVSVWTRIRGSWRQCGRKSF